MSEQNEEDRIQVEEPGSDIVDETALRKMDKDLRKACELASPAEIRYMVDSYYGMQKNRIEFGNRIAGMDRDSNEERKERDKHEVLDWIAGNNRVLENQVKLALNAFARANPMCQWAMQIDGIGPVLSAGLVAHINMDHCPTVGHIWAFAGLDPTKSWGKGEKRPWNARLKTLCWKIGESFVKVSGKETDIYGKVYIQRKAYESAKNEAGDYKEQALVRVGKVGDDTKAITFYKEGKLPPGHLHSRAKRYAVKLFLSHWHGEAFRRKFGKEPPLPYPIAFLGHTHMIKAPSHEGRENHLCRVGHHT